jgi:hypothetical protein
MADNTVINPGVGGDTMASDDIGGVKHQRVKISIGGDGSATDAVGGAGAVAAGVQRVTLASDDPAVVSLAALDDAVAGNEIQVDVVGALPAGTNNIGDVDIASHVPGTGATNLGKAVDNAAGATDTGVATLMVRDDALSTLTPIEGDYVPMRSDSTGRLWVSAAIDTALPAGTNAIGTLAANPGVNIGEVSISAISPGSSTSNLGKAEDNPHQTGDVGVQMLAVRASSPANTSSANGDYEPLQVDGGLLWARLRGIQTPNGDAAMDDTANAVKVILVDTAGDPITAGSEYTHNDTDATPSGAISMWHDTSDIVRATSATYPFPVSIQSAVPGVGPTSLGKAEDDQHTTGDTGVAILGRRQNIPANSAGANLDYCTIDVGADGGVWVSPTAATAGGCDTYVSDDIDETEEEVKATAGTLYGAWVTNTAATTRYINFYNATAANTTVGTTAVKIRVGIPGNTSDDIAAVLNLPSCGVKFDTAICVSATTNLTTGAPGAGEVQITVFFK